MLSWSQFQSARIGGLLVHDMVAFVVSATVIYLWLMAVSFLSDKNILNQKTTRKILHITAAPLLHLTWPLFSSAPEASYVAAMVPFLNFLRIAVNGLGIVKDERFVQSISRTGKRTELLTGPVCYAAICTLVAAFFWRSSVTSQLTVGVFTGGDGMADIIGRRFGKHKIPYNKKKSVEGSIAFVVFGFLMAIGLASYFVGMGLLDPEVVDGRLCSQMFLVSVVCALAESLPLTSVVDDNFIVPVTAVLTCYMLQVQ